jgi:spore coat polysaccharide biosynthesis protein SpsF
MGSSRLPGKVLEVAAGQPLLGHLLDRLQRVLSLSSIVVATTCDPRDDPIVAFCKERQVTTFRGSEEDVLARYYEAAVEAKAEVVVRITSDCPLLDPLVVEQVVSHFMDERSSFDYVSNCFDPTFPRGMNVEVFSFKALEQAHREASRPEEREHVTPYFYRHPELFRLGSFQYRLTVDTPEDLQLIRQIFESLYPSNPNFSLSDIYELLRAHPEWVHINAHIKQKAV